MARSALQHPARNPSMRNASTTSIAYQLPYDWHRMAGFFAARRLGLAPAATTPKLSPRAAVGIRR